MQAPEVTLKWRIPKQLRGIRTRDRILDAAARLLRDRSLHDIAVGDLVREARTSVGSFYHLFDSKKALVGPLYARYDRAITEGSVQILDVARWRGRSLGYRATRLIRYAVRLYRHERQLMQALVVHAREHSDELTREQHGHRAGLYDRVTQLFLVCRDEITHSDPERAIRLGLFFVGASCRDKILFPKAPQPRSVELGDPALARELAAAFLAYLQMPRPSKESPHVS